MMYLSKILILIIITFIGLFGNSIQTDDGNLSNVLRYSPAILKALRPTDQNITRNSPYHTPNQCNQKSRKRGRRGGVRTRFRRRPFRPPLPSIIFGNVWSINNKMDELRGNTRYLHEYREAAIIAITETWLYEEKEIPDAFVEIDGYSIERGDRSEASGKDGGGGVCVYINDRWCKKHNIHVTHKQCTPNAEILGVSLRPNYMPREFPKIVVNVVYVPPSANNSEAVNEITTIVRQQQMKSPDAVILTCGDFNRRTLDQSLPNFYQYVDVATRMNSILDLCYGNVDNAYTSKQLPPLGSSDHHMIHLVPKYRSVLKREAVKKKTIEVWNEDNLDSLKGCMECTDWSVFMDRCDNLDELNDHVCSYINFCVNNIRETKEVRIFPNSKPWVNEQLKQCLSAKRRAYLTDDVEQQKASTKTVKEEIKLCKDLYRQKLENSFKMNNIKETWKQIKTMTGCKKNSLDLVVHENNINEYANRLNDFYARFDCHDFKKEGMDCINEMLLNGGNCEPFVVKEEDVKRTFVRLEEKKACGPDGVRGFVLKKCANQLKFIFTHIFNLSLRSHRLPTSWKTSEIIPVPKRPNIKELNDLRPIALTSLLAKCLERIIAVEIKKCLEISQDSMQFAYRSKRSVEDAILVFLDNVYRHLDTPKNYCRIMFVDFSSAFNTIQPHLIIKTLENMKVNVNIIAWIYDFLTFRPQYVKLKNVTTITSEGNSLNHSLEFSDVRITNTGAPQGAVISPLLFTAYTNECQVESKALIKFADDTMIQGLISCSEIEYRNNIDWFAHWCKEHFLLLNVNKTKELIIDFRLKKAPLLPILIDGQEIEIVNNYKYLGITIDNELNWKMQADLLNKKLNTRMHFLRKLNSFHVDKKILQIFYKSYIESIISFALICWGGNAREAKINKLDKCIKRANKIVFNRYDNPSSQLLDFQSLYLTKCQRKILSIVKDPTYPLLDQIRFSKRSGRPLPLRTKRDRYKKSFMPTAIKLL